MALEAVRPHSRKLLFVAALSCAAGWLGLQFSEWSGSASLIWPVSGIALALMVLHGARLWPGVYAGLAVASLLVERSLPLALLAPLPAVISWGLCAWWLRHRTRFDIRLERLSDVRALVLAATGGAALSATLGVPIFWLFGHIPAAQTGAAWLAWWAGDFLGVLYLAPFVFALACGVRLGAPLRSLWLVIALTAGVFGLAALGLFFEPLAALRYFGWFPLFVLAVWTAVSMRLRELASVNLLIGSLTVMRGFAGLLPTIDGRMTFVHAFLAFMALTTLFLFATNAERRRAMREARDSEDRFRSLAELSADWVWEQDEQLRFTYISAGFAGTGCDPGDLLGRPRWKSSYYDQTDPKWASLRALQEAHRPFRHQVHTLTNAQGETVYVEISGEACYDKAGAFRGYRGVGRDITVQKRAEERALELQRRFETIVHASPYPIAISGFDDAVLKEVNAAWLQMTGYRRDEVIGRSTLELGLWVEPEQRAQIRSEVMARGSVAGVEIGHRRKDGSELVVLFAASRLDLGGEPVLLTQLADVTEQRRAARRIEELATRDSLTGLPNRLLLGDRLNQSLRSARRDETGLAVMFIDLDRFKRINDSLGHPVGDALLKEVAARIAEVLRSGDTLARLGGDEFVVLLQGIRQPEDAAAVARKILGALGQAFQIAGHSLSSGASIGISVYPGDGEDEATLMRHADTAMYHAKENGRNRYQFFAAQMNARALERLELESRLRRALEAREFVAYYQPRFRISDGALVGAEALARWREPQRGIVMPGEFIHVLEDTGFIEPFGDWMIGEVCAQLRAWHAHRPPCVAINVSARQFGRRLPEVLAANLAANGLPARAVEVEITETTLIRNLDESAALLGRLRELGVGVAIDDFGTGYSSLSHLRRFAVNVVKIDGSFVRELPWHAADQAIVRAVIDMARGLGLRTIAEGVETALQLEWLRKLGCDEYQGYYGCRPIPAQEFEERFLAVAA